MAAMEVRKLLDAWPVVRQLRGQDRLGLGTAARSAGSAALAPRTSQADKVVESICPYCAVGCAQKVYVKDGAVRPELAAERGLRHGDWATIVTARSAIEAKVLVTKRMQPLRREGRVVHQVALPWHFGPKGLAVGDSPNDLFPIVLDSNIQESKVSTCDIRPGRRPRGPALPRMVEEHRRRAGLSDGGGGR